MSGFIRLSKILAKSNGNIFFECPACEMLHGINCSEGRGPTWSWNGDVDKPTFSPSVLVRYRKGNPPATMDNLGKITSGEITQKITNEICHSFVRNGKIEFLGDCTHALAGKTVDIPEWSAECQ